MDKRTLIYIFAFGLAMFGVNYYFDSQHQKTVSEWKAKQEQQAAAKGLASPSPAPLPQANLNQPKKRLDQKYYVIENEFQQLVFTNYGGALAEINLPFQSKANSESVVKEINYDRLMKENHPYNARFPLHPYFTADSQGKIQEHIEGQLGGYYPLIRRDLVEDGKFPSITLSPQFYALNIVSDFPETAELLYEVKEFTDKKITFESSMGHRKITKTFTVTDELANAPYSLDLEISIDGESKGLWLSSGVPEVEWINGSPAPALKYRFTRVGNPEIITLDPPKESMTISSISPDWVCNSNGFLGMILDPLGSIDSGLKAAFVPGKLAPSRLVEIDQEYQRFQTKDLPGYQMLLPLRSSGGKQNFRIFAGPFSTPILKQVDAVYTNEVENYNPDYISCQTFHGWFSFISEPFAKFLMVLLTFFHSLTNSWAFSIILLTVALRVMLYPLNAWSTKSMLAMQKIGPEVAALQEKYKKDKQKLQIEMMNLYRARGVNPLSGCLPLLIQMPFLIGMFDLLKSTFELRGASFIPGWIDDLAAPDVLFSWSRPIFFIGNEFHLLPFLLGGVMFLQQNMMSPLPKDQSQWTDQQRQQRAMGNMMTIVFTVMFYHFPSGLNIYWLSSMLLGIAQNWWTARQMNRKPKHAQNHHAVKKVDEKI